MLRSREMPPWLRGVRVGRPVHGDGGQDVPRPGRRPATGHPPDRRTVRGGPLDAVHVVHVQRAAVPPPGGDQQLVLVPDHARHGGDQSAVVLSPGDRDGELRPGVAEVGGVAGVDERDPGQPLPRARARHGRALCGGAVRRGVALAPGGEHHPAGTPEAVVVRVPGGGDGTGTPALDVGAVPAVRARGGGFDGQCALVVVRTGPRAAQGAVGVVEHSPDTDGPAHLGGEPVEPFRRHMVLGQPQRRGLRGRGERLQRPGVVGVGGLRRADQSGRRGERERGPGQRRPQRLAPPAPTMSAAMLHNVLPRRANSGVRRSDRPTVEQVRVAQERCYGRRPRRGTKTPQIRGTLGLMGADVLCSDAGPMTPMTPMTPTSAFRPPRRPPPPALRVQSPVAGRCSRPPSAGAVECGSRSRGSSGSRTSTSAPCANRYGRCSSRPPR
ncbi:hypothetical protein SHIRM173S_05006 [Streptomyces hirsutus]